ncbi:serine hydrolase domain-containing protein [Candidatus Bipolaricaulota bacterium]
MRILKRIGVTALALALLAALAFGGLFLWAPTATDTSQLARGLWWGGSDVDDWTRFPPRPVSASPEPVSFPNARPDWLAELRVDDTPFEIYAEESNTTALIILHGDELLYEGYFNGGSREATLTSMSVAKSFTSTLVGIAIDEGLIASLDDSITVYLPELADRDQRFAKITIRHLLTMTSGLRYRSWTSPWDDPTTTYYAPDLRSAALNRTEIVEEPGTRFVYNDYNPILIGMILERTTGMSVAEYLEAKLWQAMGSEGDGSWSLDSKKSGMEKMQAGLNARAIDFAKLGWLFLNQGRHGDRQVVPADWVEEATRLDITTDPARNYQYFWWIDETRGGYYAEGDFCQYIYVYPKADLVIVRMGRDCADSWWYGLLGDIAQWIEVRLPD